MVADTAGDYSECVLYGPMKYAPMRTYARPSKLGEFATQIPPGWRVVAAAGDERVLLCR
jgi:hypothetical protein